MDEDEFETGEQRFAEETPGVAANPQCDDEPGDKRPLAKRR